MISIFPLNNEDKGHLQRLNKNQPAIFALKKLFLNVSTKSKLPAEVNVLAAERIALDIIQDAFQQLSVMQVDSTHREETSNMV